ncbi:ABC transporter permease [Corynebacterium crudilactis]|uniref:Transport permease protein n=1 Tax=Corynebacterium crudilactis TaxID=1652495 RepID=A0A172QTK1_9CORY|nr:ABC transporter permease [Corynebacterium crudilactis]ANE03990.1 multidrug ABC transporter permease [Corynebacterium crudilactis]
MNIGFLYVTAKRVLLQLREDKRSIVLLLGAPVALMSLFYYMYSSTPAGLRLFETISTVMIAVFPLMLMFLLTSVTMQRERNAGTLERLWTTRIHRGDLIGGYSLAFGLMAIAQSLLMVLTLRYVLGVETAAEWWISTLIAAITGLIGVSLGLLSSAFASSEFQAIQTLPLVILPQFLLCGLLIPRENLPDVLRWISNALPLSYAVDAALEAAQTGMSQQVIMNILICMGFAAGFLTVAALSMPRTSR